MVARFLPRITVASAVLCLAACPGTNKGPARPTVSGPHLMFHAGLERSPARLVLEIDPRKKPTGPATLHTFNLSLEETTSAVGPDAATISARLVDVVGASGEPQLSDQLALALDDLKITFRRTARAEVLDLKIEGVRKPLDEPTVRAIVTTLFGAARGPSLPDHEVALQDEWTVEATTDVVGVPTHQTHDYRLVASEGSRWQLREKGRIDGASALGSQRRRVTGDTFADETLDLQRGVVVSAEYEWNVRVDDESGESETPGVGRTRVRAERGTAAAPRKH
jgi:hypothetical protein